ncbi:MAG: hypothetical protein KDA84_28580, partial [Planctomycetaceae bacterium]|nr:hypothetical protein [Planctomycetaceae bacterium]
MRLFLLGLLSLFVVYPAVSGADDEVDFERHIAPLLSKHGCNSGACHGSFAGRGGFRLSLFGHDPQADFQAMTREAQGRRINRLHPELSLLLKKSLMRVAHQGGRRFGANSEAAHLLQDWIANGA